MDSTKAVQCLSEVQDSICSAFQWATKEGLLCEDILRGIKFNLIDASLHPDAIHRGAGQMIPAARKLFKGIQFLSEPILLESFVDCYIKTETHAKESIYGLLSQKRGILLDENTETYLNSVEVRIA